MRGERRLAGRGRDGANARKERSMRTWGIMAVSETQGLRTPSAGSGGGVGFFHAGFLE